MSGGACSEDTLVRARRGLLPADQTRALEAHLATCALCRTSVALGRMVGPLPPVDEQDQAMARRLVARHLEPHAVPAPRSRVGSVPGRAQRWRGARTMAVAASVLLMASVASAAYWTVHVKAARRTAIGRPPAQPAAVNGPSRRAALPPNESEPAPDQAPARAPSPPAVSESPSAPTALPVDHPARATNMASVDPEALLRDANEARRVRRPDEAARRYRALQARFPSSREAVLSHLSLGHLCLAEGAFTDALAQFQAYLRDGGELAEEALLGEARALAALGRRDDERAVWRALQSRFPASEYLWRARERLGELDRGAAP